VEAAVAHDFGLRSRISLFHLARRSTLASSLRTPRIASTPARKDARRSDIHDRENGS